MSLITLANNVIYVTGYVFRNIFVIGLWIGWAITATIIGIFKGVAYIANNALLGVTVLWEDFLEFNEDFFETCEKLAVGILDLICESFSDLVCAVCVVVNGIISTPDFIMNAVSSMKFGSQLVHLCILVRDAFLLLGICVWESFAFLFTVLSYLNKAPYILFFLIARAIDKILTDFILTVQTHLFRSLCGLLICAGVWMTMKRAGMFPKQDVFSIAKPLVRKCAWKCLVLSHLLWREGVAITGTAFGLVRKTNRVARYMTQSTKSWMSKIVRDLLSYTPTNAGLRIRLEKELEARRCVVCMDRPRNIIILNCRHLLLCKHCAMTCAVSTGKCPVCRSNIEDMISVYV